MPQFWDIAINSINIYRVKPVYQLMNQIIEAQKSKEMRIEAQTNNLSAIIVTNAQLSALVTCPKQKVPFFFQLPIS